MRGRMNELQRNWRLEIGDALLILPVVNAFEDPRVGRTGGPCAACQEGKTFCNRTQWTLADCVYSGSVDWDITASSGGGFVNPGAIGAGNVAGPDTLFLCGQEKRVG
jgi:hypothetical protein